MNKILKVLLFSLLSLILFVFSSFAQTFNCVKAGFEKDIAGDQSLIEAEAGFCDEFKENSDLLELYGFVVTSKIARIVRVYKGKAVFTHYEDNVRYSERDLTDKELETLRFKLKEMKPETEPPRQNCLDMCSRFEFLTINRGGGGRISFISYRYNPPEPMDKLAEFFKELTASGDFKNTYYIQNKEKGFEILLADNVWSARAVWKKGDDFRVLVEDSSKWKKNSDDGEKFYEDNRSAPQSYENRLKLWKRRDEIKNAAYVWRKFENGKLGEITDAPDGIPYFSSDWRRTINGFQYENVCVSDDDCALVKVDKSQKASVVRKGFYQTFDIVVSPEGKWLVATKKDKKSSWENLVRINLQTNEEIPVDLELSYDFDVISYIPAHNKFLIRQRKWTGYQKKDLLLTFLLDAETGKPEKLDGDFQPLEYQSQDRKPLQPAQNPNTFWTAKHNFRGTTGLGIYDTKSFAVQPVAAWSDMEFDSNDMWVDEKEMKIYFVYNGHLLALPLPNKTLPN